MKEKKKIGSKIFMALMMIFFYAPIVYIIIFSLNSSRSLTHFDGFSLRWYEKMFSDRTMMQSIVYTIVIAVLATIISTIVGTITSIGLSKSKPILKKTVEQINNLPIMNPESAAAWASVIPVRTS